MTLSAHNISLVQASFKQVKPVSDSVASLFYEHLFDLDPSLKPLFVSNLVDQGAKLMAALSLVVSSLKNPTSIIPMIEVIAIRHLDYGVEEEHYSTVGEALLLALAELLGDDFLDEHKDAWKKAFSDLSSVMILAARNHASCRANDF